MNEHEKALERDAREEARQAKCAKALSCFKILLLVALTLYLWMAAAGDRRDSLALLRVLGAGGRVELAEL